MCCAVLPFLEPFRILKGVNGLVAYYFVHRTQVHQFGKSLSQIEVCRDVIPLFFYPRCHCCWTTVLAVKNIAALIDSNEPVLILPLGNVIGAKVPHGCQRATRRSYRLQLKFKNPFPECEDSIRTVTHAICRSLKIEKIDDSIFTGIILGGHYRDFITKDVNRPFGYAYVVRRRIWAGSLLPVMVRMT